MNVKTIGGALAALLIVALIAAQIFGGKDDPEPAPEPTSSPTATLNPDDPGTEPTAGPSDTPATSDTPAKPTVSEAQKAAQFKAAADYTVAYFSYSYRDKSLNDFVQKVKPYSTTEHYHELLEDFPPGEGDQSNAWDDIRKERTVVTAAVTETTFDPWYDPTPNKSVVVVTYVQTTQDAVGTGGTGTAQTFKVEVSKVGDKYLVSNTIFADSSAGQ